MAKEIVYEMYCLMKDLGNGDLELCFDEEGYPIENVFLEKIRKEKQYAEENNYYDFPLVIVKEMQEVIE